MEENTNQVQEQTAVEEQGKTFSQEDVNRIVGERLAKEKAKNESDWQQRERDLQRRELQMTAKEYLNEKNIPVELLDALSYTDEETLQKSVAVIEKFIEEKTQEAKRPKIVEIGQICGPTPGAPIGNDDEAIRKAMRLP